MSFLSLIGGSKRNPAPAQPTAPTADTKNVHAQMSLPSRQGTADFSVPTARGKEGPSRSQRGSTSSSTPPSRSSTVDNKTQLLHEGPPASGIGLSPSASEISLLETLDDEATSHVSNIHAHANSGASAASFSFPKPSTSPEQEWLEIETDSSDEDGYTSADHVNLTAPSAAPKASQSSSKPLHESGVLVEDDQVKARRLAEELSTTQETLSELRKQNAMLQQRLKGLEQESQEKEAQIKAMKETNDADKIKASRKYAATMEAKRKELRELQNTIEVLQRESRVWEEKVEMLLRENEVLRKEAAKSEDQSRRDQEEIEGMKNEVDAANNALRTFKDRSKTLIGSEREENKKLKERADDLWHQLEVLKKQLKERDEQIHHLQLSSESTDNSFRTAEAAAQEKDKALNEAQRHVASLEKQRDTLHTRVIEMETEVVEARNAAQRLLAKANEDQKYESSLASDRLQTLEKELSSYSTTIQQLRTSLKASRANEEGATKLSESRALEIESLQKQLSILEDELHSKEQDLIDASAGRASLSHLEDKVAKLNMTIERLKSDHAVESHHLDLQATKERARVSQLETEASTSRERIRELRSRLELCEQSRRMLRDQLARREEESRRGHPESSNGASAGPTNSTLNLTSSIIHDPAHSTSDQLFNLLRNLNYEIFQISALLADSLSSIPRSSTNTSISDVVDQETTSLLGPYLHSLVRSQSTSPLESYDPHPLQTAIQATLVCCATRIMTAWYPGHWDHSDFLAATYLRIREAEGSAASDTWKAMTRARLRPTTTTVVRVVDFLEECLDMIFRFAGWPAAKTAKTSSGSGASSPTGKTVEGLLRDHHEKLSALARHSLRINVLFDGVTPQLEPAFVEPGSVFDPYVMECDDNGKADEDDEVVSTSEIGLRKVVVESKASAGNGSVSISRRRRIVLRPKVVLRSAFDHDT